MRLHAALSYRARGWAVLPLHPSGNKEPHCAALERVHGSPKWKPLTARPASEPEIRAWFEHDPETNLGIITGQPSGRLVVADVDKPDKARDLRHPPTAIAQARRGPHVYLHADGPFGTTGTPWGELRGDGSYAVAPPSIHESGHEYAWLVRPEEASLASLDALQVETPPTEGGTQVEVPLPRYPEGVEPLPGTGGDLARLDHAVTAALPVLGIDAPLGRKFSCVLPGHGPDRHPSAATHRGPDGIWRYMDFHRPSDPHSLTLAEVRASRSAGRIVRLAGPSQARWYRRLFHEAGVLPAHPKLPELPAELSPGASQLAKGFALLLALRELDDNGPAPYTRRFASAWCGMGERQAGEGLKELVGAGVLVKAEEHGLLWLFEFAQSERRRKVA